MVVPAALLPREAAQGSFITHPSSPGILRGTMLCRMTPRGQLRAGHACKSASCPRLFNETLRRGSPVRKASRKQFAKLNATGRSRTPGYAVTSIRKNRGGQDGQTNVFALDARRFALARRSQEVG